MPGESRAEQPPDTAQPGTEQPGTEQPGTGQPSRGQLNAQIEECVFELTGRMIGQVERIAQRLAVPAVFIKALHTLDAPMAMKDLGKRMHCDPSFVTGIADMLEKRGLAVRESDPADRRVKRLVLSSAGLEMKHQMEQAMLERSPWRQSLTGEERATLISLIHKMAPPLSATNPADCPAEEVTNFLATAATPRVG